MSVQSRRERPAKPALTRQGIIETALRIMNDEGLGKVTMRRVAAALDTGHASLYVYVRDTEDLHAQILDTLIAPLVEAGATGETWRDRVRSLLVGYRNVLATRPELARMALSTQPSGPNYLALVEAVLALLHEGGADDRAAAWGVDMLLLYPTALAAEHTAREPAKRAAGDLDTLRDVLAGIDAIRMPHIARLGGLLVSGDPDERAAWALDVLLDGILNAALPPGPA
ncbi:TetR/AcrR family transcriptional regulator [Pseudosporangium ferrugineum]|uniref:TetR family transcriptional regulator n=1 Tax=Pseudosporangium ferrugineum TaxID=439699 RepID=A0A2T0SEE8_9ACTN|nr:TetR/AcrR family transcriptional regulator C-terminal domain-containing protein [Pseudosporangium ferrugineum]PRY31796.1 TetR family transcriptional regulator [Pseudosporangium ferrugineum]